MNSVTPDLAKIKSDTPVSLKTSRRSIKNLRHLTGLKKSMEKALKRL